MIEMARHTAYTNGIQSGGFLLTEHGAGRAAQRGVTIRAIMFVLAHGDIECRAARTRRALRLSRTKAAELLADGQCFHTVEQAQRIELILGHLDAVITVLRCDPRETYRRVSRQRSFFGA
jgi:hypothetical protein